jgi:hypothetical protein
VFVPSLLLTTEGTRSTGVYPPDCKHLLVPSAVELWKRTLLDGPGDFPPGADITVYSPFSNRYVDSIHKTLAEYPIFESDGLNHLSTLFTDTRILALGQNSELTFRDWWITLASFIPCERPCRAETADNYWEALAAL